jgi:hypothetical protein
MEKSDSIKELAKALCKFQGEVEKVRKSEINPFFKSKYADLSSILNVIRTPLTENGLSFVQFPIAKNGLETMLMHESGEWMCATYEMKPTKDDPQGLGSAITYQRRYALGAILGLNIDDDDDGNNASKPVKQSSRQPVSQTEDTNEPLTDLQIAIYDMSKAGSLEVAKQVWDEHKDLWKNEQFIREANRIKAKLKPQTV